MIVVASGGYPQSAVPVGYQTAQIDVYIDVFFYLKRCHIYHAHRALVVGHSIAATVGNIYLVVNYLYVVGLIAHYALRHHLQRGGVDFCHIAELLIIGVDYHGSGITGDVGITLMKGYVAAVGYVHLPYAPGAVLVHNFHLVRAVNHGIQAAAVHCQVIAHIAEFFGHIGIGIAVDIAGVNAGAEVVVVEGALIAAHIAFVEQIKPAHGAVVGIAHLHFLGDEYHIIFAAGIEHGAQQCHKHYYQYVMIAVSHQMSNFKISL